jgi:hypothetical protein
MRNALYQLCLRRAKCRVEDRIRGYSLTKLDAVFAIIANYRNAVIRMLTATDESTAAEWEGVARRLHERWKDFHGDNSLHELAFNEPGPLHIEEFSKAAGKPTSGD